MPGTAPASVRAHPGSLAPDDSVNHALEDAVKDASFTSSTMILVWMSAGNSSAGRVGPGSCKHYHQLDGT